MKCICAARSRRSVNKMPTPVGTYTEANRTPTGVGVQTEEVSKKSKFKDSQVRRGTDATKWLRVEYGRYMGAHKVLLHMSGGAKRGIEVKSRIPLCASAQARESVKKYQKLER